MGHVLDSNALMRLILPAVSIGAGVLLGLLLEKIAMVRLERIARKTSWQGDDIVIRSVRWMVFFWCVLGGLYGAVIALPIPARGMRVLQELFIAVVILSGTIVVARIAVGFTNLYSRKAEGLIPSASIFANLTRAAVYLLGILIILDSLGISITPILTALGVGGLAVALALQDTLSNLFSGIHILVTRQIRPGDFIKLSTGEKGYITDITWRNTTLRELPNNLIVIPNSKLASAVVTNYYKPAKELAVLVQVGVSYDSDLKRVEKATVEVAKEVMNEVPGGVPDFEPFVRYHTFADSSVNFSVIMRGQEFTDQYLIAHEFIKRLHKRFEAERIVIPFPMRTVQFAEASAARHGRLEERFVGGEELGGGSK